MVTVNPSSMEELFYNQFEFPTRKWHELTGEWQRMNNECLGKTIVNNGGNGSSSWHGTSGNGGLWSRSLYHCTHTWPLYSGNGNVHNTLCHPWQMYSGNVYKQYLYLWINMMISLYLLGNKIQDNMLISNIYNSIEFCCKLTLVKQLSSSTPLDFILYKSQ